MSRNILHFSFYVVGILMKGLKTGLREECHNVKLPKVFSIIIESRFNSYLYH